MYLLVHAIDQEDVERQVHSSQGIHVGGQLLDDFIQVTVIVLLSLQANKSMLYLICRVKGGENKLSEDST